MAMAVYAKSPIDLNLTGACRESLRQFVFACPLRTPLDFLSKQYYNSTIMRKQSRQLEAVLRRQVRPLDPTRPHVILRVWAANYFVGKAVLTTTIVEEILKPKGDHLQYEVENINDEIKFMFQVRWSYQHTEEFKARMGLYLVPYEATPQYTMNLWAKGEAGSPMTLPLDLKYNLTAYRSAGSAQSRTDGDVMLRTSRLQRRSPRRTPRLSGCMDLIFYTFERHNMGAVPASEFNDIRLQYSHQVFKKAKALLEIESVRRGPSWVWQPPKQHPDGALQRAHTARINAAIASLHDDPENPARHLKLLKRPSVDALREAMIAHRYYMTREQVYTELSMYTRKTILKAKQVLGIKTRKTIHWYWVYPAAELRNQLIDILATGPKPQKDIYSLLGTLPARVLMATMRGITRKFVGKTTYWVSDIGTSVEDVIDEPTPEGKVKVEKTAGGVKIDWLQ